MKVITVYKTHVDIGFTDLPHKVLENYSSHMLEDVVTTCEQSQKSRPEHQFIWTMPAFPLLYSLEHADNSLRARAEALIRRNQLVWHALPFTLRTEFFSRYELEQSLFYAKELCRIYEKPMPISAKMTDVPGHTMGLVDALTSNGVKFLHLGCNGASTPPDVPQLFWWESKSGNRILTYYDKQYGGVVIPPEDWKYPVHLAMCVTTDNTGVQKPGTVEKLAEELKGFDPSAEFTTGTMDDFARDILKCDLSDLPVIRGELGDTWIHGLGAFPESCSAIYSVRPLFQRISKYLAEKGDTSFKDLQRKYLENTLLFGEHSGGVSSAVYIGKNRKYDKKELLAELESEQFKYANNGWNDERGWAFTAHDAAIKLKDEVEKKYSVSFSSPVIKGTTENDNWRINEANGEIVLINKRNKKEISLSYFYQIIGRQSIEDFINSYLRQRYDWALCDFGRYTLDGTNTYPEIEDKLFLPLLNKKSVTDSKMILEYINPDESVSAFGNAEKVTISASVEGEKVHVNVAIENKQPTMYADAGHVCFNIGEKITDIDICKCGNDINPATDIVPGANTVLFAVDGYVIANGIKFEPVQTPLLSFGESKIYKYNAGKFEMPENGKILFNTYNNMWGTGAPQWVQGSFSYDYYVSITD